MIPFRLAATLVVLAAASPARAEPSAAPPAQDTLTFSVVESDTLGGVQSDWSEPDSDAHEEWLRAPFREELVTDPDRWARSGHDGRHTDLLLDYNRVDELRLGLRSEAQSPHTLRPRMGMRLEYGFGRKRFLYGALLDQPLTPTGIVSVGAAFYRKTDHGDLQQVSDGGGALALLLARQDYRDYFEREGVEGYVSSHLRPVTHLSLHVMSDDYRSLRRLGGAGSLFFRERRLRDNPPVEEGNLRSLVLRADRQALRTGRTRAGVYHWGEVEWAGDRLGGDFTFTRALGDLRSYVRLSPGQVLSLRVAAGSTLEGALPFQKQFTVGGVDGLRAHSFAHYRGEQVLLGGAEYSVNLWQGDSFLPGAPHVIAFADCGKAWSNGERAYDLGRQRIPVDGGFGLASSEDDFRVYFAKKLQEPGSDLVISVRLQRTF
jgi:hypothetical protein